MGNGRSGSVLRSRPENAMLLAAPASKPKEADLTRTYDAVVVGSGAAGGMAAHVLTSPASRC